MEMTLEALPQNVHDAQAPHRSRPGKPSQHVHPVKAIMRNPMLNDDVIRLDGAIRVAPR